MHAYVERKVAGRRHRIQAFENTNDQYSKLKLDEDYIRHFGFPDNSAVADPDTTIIGQNVDSKVPQNQHKGR